MECDRLDVIIPAAALVPSVSVDDVNNTPSSRVGKINALSSFVVKFASFPRSSFSVLPVVVLPPTADFDRDFDRFFLFFPILNVSSINNDKTGAFRADQTREEILRVCVFFLRVRSLFRVRLDLACGCEFVLDFLRDVLEIFLVSIQTLKTKKRNLKESVGKKIKKQTPTGKQKCKGERRLFLHKNTHHHLFFVRLHTHTLKHARRERERERERGDDDDADDGAYYYYYYFYSVR